MGRLEEALRRAGVNQATPATNVSRPSPQLFTSAWGAAVADNIPATDNLIGNAFCAFSAEWVERLVLPGNSNHMLIEQFRHLAGGLHQAQTEGKLKSVMVTSGVPGDGKTFTALNLGLTLANSYARRVLLIDADLRRPSLDQICGIRSINGLSEALRSDEEQKLPVFQLIERLTFLPAGRPDPDPMSGLTSSRMKRILDEAAEEFDWIIVDAPPATPLADAGLLGAMVDATLLVVRAGATHVAPIQKAIEALGRDRIFGVVLNGAEQVSLEYRPHYGTRSHGPE
jgi:capsular exopolysaccharide synthesis family protein